MNHRKLFAGFVVIASCIILSDNLMCANAVHFLVYICFVLSRYRGLLLGILGVSSALQIMIICSSHFSGPCENLRNTSSLVWCPEVLGPVGLITMFGFWAMCDYLI